MLLLLLWNIDCQCYLKLSIGSQKCSAVAIKLNEISKVESWDWARYPKWKSWDWARYPKWKSWDWAEQDICSKKSFHKVTRVRLLKLKVSIWDISFNFIATVLKLCPPVKHGMFHRRQNYSAVAINQRSIFEFELLSWSMISTRDPLWKPCQGWL